MTRRDEAVSSVVSAVLLVALLTTALTVWTFTMLPQWIADREAAHQGDAQEAMGLAKAGMDALAAQDAPGPATVVFDLAPGKVPMLQRAPASGVLAFEDGFRVTASFTGAVLHLQDGSAAGLPDEDAAGATISQVAALTAFSFGLSTSNVQATGDEGWVELVLDDGVDTVTARLSHFGTASAAGCTASGVALTVVSPLGTRVTPLLCGVGLALTDYTLDLSAQPTFAAGLRELGEEFTLTVSDGFAGGAGAAVGKYAAVWTDTDGIEHASGAGTPTSYTLDRQGGRLAFEPRYQRFPSQALVYEGGAVIATQGASSEAVLVDPSFELRIDEAAGTGVLRWTLVDLDGSGSRTGADTATAFLRHDGSSDLLFEVTGATFTITSTHAEAWRGFFADRVLASSTEAAADGDGTGDTATLTLSAGGATGVTSWLVHLQVIDGDATIR